MKRRIILIVTSIFLTITLLFTSTACLSKKTETATTPTPIEQLQTRAASLESKVASLVEQVSALRTQVPPNLQPAIDQLKADLTTISTKIARLEVRIAELETEKEAVTSGDVDPEDAVTVKYKATTPYVIAVPANDKRTQVVQVKLTVENELPVDLEDIEVSAEIGTITAQGVQATDIEVGIISLGGEIDFQGSGGSYDSWDSISLKAGERDSYTLDLTLLITNKSDTAIEQYVNTLRITVRGECEDYEVAK